MKLLAAKPLINNLQSPEIETYHALSQKKEKTEALT